MRRFRSSWLPLLLASTAAGSGGAAAQTVTLLTGRTLDYETDAPLQLVDVDLIDAGQRRVASAVTDSAGRFRFVGIAGGEWRLRAGSIGYRNVVTPPVTLTSGDTVDVIVRLAVDAVPLAPLEVVARAKPIHTNPGLAGFYRRVERDLGGRFILREEIEQRNQRRVTDLLITAGVNVIGDPRDSDHEIFMKRTGCPPAVWLDGIPLRGLKAYDLVNTLAPFDVEGIEVYPGPATVPAEYGGPAAGCGVVAIWSRRGG